MADFALWPVLAGSAAFFLVGLVWYGPLFGAAWRRAAHQRNAPAKNGRLPLIFILGFAFEMLIAMVLWHLIARTNPPSFVVMMMALGFAIGIMIPALGINYLLQRRSAALFAIDAGHFVVGMAAMGGVFVLMRGGLAG